MNKGLAFEWCIYHLIAKVNPKKFANDAVAKTAKTNYDLSPKDVQKNALKAIGFIEKSFGTITDVEKTLTKSLDCPINTGTCFKYKNR